MTITAFIVIVLLMVLYTFHSHEWMDNVREKIGVLLKPVGKILERFLETRTASFLGAWGIWNVVFWVCRVPNHGAQALIPATAWVFFNRTTWGKRIVATIQRPLHRRFGKCECHGK